MSANTINARIKCKYDTISNWTLSSLKPLVGEICVAVLPNTSNNYNVGTAPDSTGLTPYAIGIKVGDGVRTFNQLPWIQAVAGDIYAWAKAATKPSYSASEIVGLDAYITAQAQDTDTQYRISAGTGTDAGKYFLQSKAKNASDSAFVTVSTIDLTGYQTSLNSITITGANGLTGGGDLSANRIISHSSRPASNTTPDATFGSSTNKYLKQIKVDPYGHIIKIEEDNVITYKFETGSTDGAISITPVSAGVDGTSVDVAVKGLKDGAFKNVASSIDFSINTNDGQIPTIGAVKAAINSSTVAVGSIYDLEENNTITENNTSVDFLIFNCGDASNLITDPT